MSKKKENKVLNIIGKIVIVLIVLLMAATSVLVLAF